VQADGNVHGPGDHVSPTLKMMTRASPVNIVSEEQKPAPRPSPAQAHERHVDERLARLAYEVITSGSLASPPPKIAPPGGGLVSGKRHAEMSFVRPQIS
jgi:hypothetical protein